MALLSIEELTTPVTPDEVKAKIYDILAAVGVKTTSWKPGAVVRTIIAACAIVIAALSELMAEIAKSGFLELSSGDWLTLVARYVFGVERQAATFAPGSVTLTNNGGGVFPMGVGDVIFKKSTTGKTYRNTEAFTLNAGPGTVLSVGVEAVEAGSDSSAGAGEIDSFETPMIGVVVTNPTALIGLDEESDPALRTRCLEKRSSYSPNGPRDAYAFVAKSATRADGTNIGVTRVRVNKSSSTGEITVLVASATGAIPGVDTDPSTDLGAIDLAIKQNVVPIGPTETTVSATPSVQPIAYELWLYNTVNLTDAELQDLIASRLATFMSTEPIGGNVIGTDPGKIFQDAIRTVIGSSRPEIFHVAVTTPPADITLASDEVPMLGVVIVVAIHREAA